MFCLLNCPTSLAAEICTPSCGVTVQPAIHCWAERVPPVLLRRSVLGLQWVAHCLLYRSSVPPVFCRSVLGVRFHVRDMLGSGALLRLDTTVGPVLRLPQKK